jgi:hypothetical protein
VNDPCQRNVIHVTSELAYSRDGINVIARDIFRIAGSARVHPRAAILRSLSHHCRKSNLMQLRYLVKLAVGTAAGALALVGVANAAPLSGAQQLAAPQVQAVQPAVVSQVEVDRLQPQEVRWGHHWHRHHWNGGWHRHWHHRHWR